MICVILPQSGERYIQLVVLHAEKL